jgi:hypothetical protein
MHTHADYLERRCTHDEYYSQYVTDRHIATVKRIGTSRILASTDPYFNDIPLCEWDRLQRDMLTQSTRDLLTRNGDFATLAVAVCIAKCAARKLRAQLS